MALHRDIFWVGRQWAVTGFGVQAVDQRLKGAFDIEVARLWEDNLPQRMRALSWLNADDFNKALDMARARFPAPPRKTLPLVESILELIQPVASEPPKPAAPRLAPALTPVLAPVSTPIAAPVATAVLAPLRPLPLLPPPADPTPVGFAPAPIPPLVFRVERASAKFLPQWRIRH